jgi:deoxyribonuclease V
MHDWNVTPQEAEEIQNRLRTQVQLTDSFALAEIKTVAGIDAAYKGDDGRCAVVVLSYPDLQPVEQATAKQSAVFPYTPGLLSFREMPLALEALGKLKTLPDLIMVDGQGYAHPRRFGFGCHLGVHLNKPVIGVAKTRFIGQFIQPSQTAGAFSPLEDTINGEEVGAVLRTQPKINPLFISVGHNISLATAIQVVMRCVTNYRLPEPTRLADILAATIT